MEHKKKIMIIGSAGSGKSYFGRELHEITGIPLYYMDVLFWRENWTHISYEELADELERIMQNDEWIIDGNYSNTMELRMKKAEVVYFLDMPVEVCLSSEAARRGKKREDLPHFLEEKYDPEFIDWIKQYQTDGRIFAMNMLEKYKDKEIHVFTSREEKERYLSHLARDYGKEWPVGDDD